jgi:hypothetical protein
MMVAMRKVKVNEGINVQNFAYPPVGDFEKGIAIYCH